MVDEKALSLVLEFTRANVTSSLNIITFLTPFFCLFFPKTYVLRTYHMPGIRLGAMLTVVIKIAMALGKTIPEQRSDFSGVNL